MAVVVPLLLLLLVVVVRCGRDDRRCGRCRCDGGGGCCCCGNGRSGGRSVRRGPRRTDVFGGGNDGTDTVGGRQRSTLRFVQTLGARLLFAEHVVDADDAALPRGARVHDDGGVRLDPRPAAALGEKAEVARGHLALDEYCGRTAGGGVRVSKHNIGKVLAKSKQSPDGIKHLRITCEWRMCRMSAACTYWYRVFSIRSCGS